MFSQDATTVSNIQSALKSMSTLEPDLILYPILERAVPSLEAVNEVCSDSVVFLIYDYKLPHRLNGQLPLSKLLEQLHQQLYREMFITQEQDILFQFFSSSSQALILWVWWSAF